MRLDAEQIRDATGGTLRVPASSGAVVTDTRGIRPGDWFLALKGARFDGHDYLEVAQKAGAIGCVVSAPVPESWRGGVVEVEDTTTAIQDLGRWARDQLSGPVIGITGSSGKTTTRTLIELAMAQLGEIHGTAGNLNNHLGVPMTLLAAPIRAKATVVEMGTSSPGEIQLLADICRPDIRVVVNVGPAHLEELGGLEGVALEKGALVRSARPSDLVVLNADDPFVREMSASCRTVAWGRHVDADLRLVECELLVDSMSTRATWVTPEGVVKCLIPAPGEHIAHNAGAALAVAWGLGLSVDTAARALARYSPVGMRLKVERVDGVVLFNDAYNANPASMAASLGVLAQMPGRRIAVLGDMLELGPDEWKWHRQIAHAAVSSGLDLVVAVGPRMARAFEGLIDDKWRFEAVEEAGPALSSWVRRGDHILFKGSRGARVERVLHHLQQSLTRRLGESS